MIHKNYLKIFSMRPFLLSDAELIHPWVIRKEASYWLMQGYSVDDVRKFYDRAINKENIDVYIGYWLDQPVFIAECYRANESELRKHYQTTPSDMGMHFLTAPKKQTIRHFTRHIIETIMSYIFEHYNCNRIVVEPDYRNYKVHKLNQQAGFIHHKVIELEEKKALLATCEKAAFSHALSLSQKMEDQNEVFNATNDQPASITPAIWQHVNLTMLAKMISEFSHERLIKPECIHAANKPGAYVLRSGKMNIEYIFSAQIMQLEHWLIDAESIEKRQNDKVDVVDAVCFAAEFADELGLTGSTLTTYCQELSSTLFSQAQKLCKSKLLSVAELVNADYQTIEMSMTEGHPTFVANNGRMGFDHSDYFRYAPEIGPLVKICWLAIARDHSVFSTTTDYSYSALIRDELDIATRKKFAATIHSMNLDPDNYWFIPVHPWQWENKLSITFASEICANRIIYLGKTQDLYTPQQSIRTFFNNSHVQRHYVKMALSIVNMGFVRGLSADYMRPTPAINEWVFEQLSCDEVLVANGFRLLREIAAIGYYHPYATIGNAGDNPYRKLLAALWRESPYKYVQPTQKLATMAALLHIDHEGNAFVKATIQHSGLSVELWLERYLNVYLTPILHCFFKHNLVFMPHGENIILMFDNHIPVGSMIKDIGEEVCLINDNRKLPELVSKIAVQMDDDVAILSIFTDVFDDFFRYLSVILKQHMGYSEVHFWRQVASCIHRYQSQHPELNEKFERYDLFASEFIHSCLNRLQLKNHKQMVDLADPAANLQFCGSLVNPIAPFRYGSY